MSLTLTPSRELPAVDAFIQCAMVMEAQPFLDALTPLPGTDAVETLNVGAEGHHQQSYALGQFAGHTVLVITSGVGIANAAAAVARGLTMATPKIVIAGGTAGGLEGGIKVGDVAGAISTIYNDADATVFGYELGQIPRMPVDYHSSQRAIDALAKLGEAQPHTVRTGRIVTGDSFASEKVVARIRAGFPDALAVDMETCGMAQVCWSNGIDWICLRAISDLTGEGADEDFHMNGETAAYHSFEAVRAYLPLFCA